MSTPAFFSTSGLLVKQSTINNSVSLLQLAGYNASAVKRYVQIHDSASSLLDGAIPLVTIPVPGSETSFSYGFVIRMQNAITIAISTTALTFTAPASAELNFSLQYTGFGGGGG